MIPDFLTKTNKTKKGTKESHLRWWVTFLMSLGLALGTWNPTGHHFIHYLTDSENILSGFTPFAIIIMVGIWLLALKSIFQSLKVFGALFVIIIIAAFLWGLQQYGLLDFKDLNEMGWAGTLSVAFIIWIGLNASLIWKSLTGVYATDNVEED
jgi:glucan phosphoethanolaminetransferase (alkaline phosphatase superfamily)